MINYWILDMMYKDESTVERPGKSGTNVIARNLFFIGHFRCNEKICILETVVNLALLAVRRYEMCLLK